jgi:alpha-beta hydrolase superfamily lysophospholipase
LQPGDPRADPTVVDLIELAGLWVAAEDWAALGRTLRRLDDELSGRFPDAGPLAQRFRDLRQLVDNAAESVSAEEIRRTYRRASVG